MSFAFKQTRHPKVKPDLSGKTPLGFGQHFTDHMFVAKFSEAENGWGPGEILPYAPLSLEPAASVLHYGQALFEGMKAFPQLGGGIALFRPEFNWQRMQQGALRLCLPIPPKELFLKACHELVRIDQDWMPTSIEHGAALYLRPTLIGSEGFLGVRPSREALFFVILSPVGSYYSSGIGQGISIWIETEDIRAAKGGLGNTKAGANYAASLRAALRAKEKGYAQVLWLDQNFEAIEEVGTMNVFFRINDCLVTPALNGSILEGGTREVVLELAKKRGIKTESRRITLAEVSKAAEQGQLQEIFGTGTAAVITPVNELVGHQHLVKTTKSPATSWAAEFLREIQDIQYGKASDPHGWRSLL